MDTSVTALLGVVFVTLGFAAVFLMFRIWGYPFDAQRQASAAPRYLVLVHRMVGLSYVALYLFMMSQMVPRLFLYQVEFPARTVAHLLLGVSIGLLLILKLSILRFFRHFKPMLPYIGAAILWCTVLLVSLSVPFAYKEIYWSSSAVGGSVYSPENIARLEKLLPTAGFPEEAPLAALATERGLSQGRLVLLSRCVTCHDLKTILTRPRTPGDWVHTVQRMAERPIFGRPIEPEEQWTVATYLIAISPELQISAKKRREQEIQDTQSRSALRTVLAGVAGAPVPAYQMDQARALFEQACTQCHDLDQIEQYPLESDQEVRDLLRRMVDNGLDASEAQIEQIAWYLMQEYVGR